MDRWLTSRHCAYQVIMLSKDLHGRGWLTMRHCHYQAIK